MSIDWIPRELLYIKDFIEQLKWSISLSSIRYFQVNISVVDLSLALYVHVSLKYFVHETHHLRTRFCAGTKTILDWASVHT